MTNNTAGGKNGFTLIETLVAVLILAVAIAGPLTIASQGLQTALVAKDQITAYYLAQDAIEYVRFIRDTNTLSGQPWLAGLDGTANGHTNGGAAGGNCGSANGCNIDSVNDKTSTCLGGPCAALNYDQSNHYYNYNTISGTNPPTTFTRTVVIQTPVGTNADEALVTASVSWRDNAGNTHPPVVERENIFRWQ